MNNPDVPPSDPSLPPQKKMTEEDFDAWLLENPKRADSLLDVLQRHLDEKRGEMTPEQVEEVLLLIRQLKDEMADFLVPEQYNSLADRLKVLLAQESISMEEVDEVRMMEEKLEQLMDMGLNLKEPRRTTVMNTLLECQKQVQLLLRALEEP